MWLRGLVGALDGQQIIRGEVRGEITDAEALGQQLAQTLLEQGAADILKRNNFV